MSKMWKIIIGIVAALALLAAIGIGFLIWGWQWMQGAAKGVYGGPLPPSVSTVMGADLQTQRFGVFMDKQTNLVVIIIEKIRKQSGSAGPFSEPDVQKALQSMDETGQLQSAFKGVESGTPTLLKVIGQPVHGVSYINTRGQKSIAGVLNLDAAQMAFVGTGQDSPSLPKEVAAFLTDMPAIKNGSHPHD